MMYTIRATSSQTSYDTMIKALVKNIFSVCSFYRILIRITLSRLLLHKRNMQRGVYTHLKTNIVKITLLFVFYKAAKNFKTVIEGLYKENNIVCFFDQFLGNSTRELMQNTQSILNGLNIFC